jgi:signal transduction histidine kinase
MKDLSLHLLDLAQNAITAGATHVRADFSADTEKDCLSLTLADNGRGMDEETIRRVQDPFYTTRTTRKVGLGIPLFKEGAIQSGGEFSLTSRMGEGTVIRGSYRLSHMDRPPMGDMAGSVLALVMANPGLDFTCTWKLNEKTFCFDTRQIRGQLAGVSLDEPEVLAWMKEYVEEGINALYGGMNL